RFSVPRLILELLGAVGPQVRRHGGIFRAVPAPGAHQRAIGVFRATRGRTHQAWQQVVRSSANGFRASRWPERPYRDFQEIPVGAALTGITKRQMRAKWPRAKRPALGTYPRVPQVVHQSRQSAGRWHRSTEYVQPAWLESRAGFAVPA